MNASQRRQHIEQLLRGASEPVSASTIAAQFGVSRQIIVGDIALLRASGLPVTATPRGYILELPDLPVGCSRTIACCHDESRLAEELYTIVDLGGTVVNVIVEHSIYGEICAPLHIQSRFDTDEFCRNSASSGARPLCDLTSGMHLHQIRARDEATLDRIEAALLEKQLLFSKS